MQHDAMRQPAPAYGSENVGDVLASIRRLIAQDEGGSPIIPNQMLNAVARAPVATPDGPALRDVLAPAEDQTPDSEAAETAMPDEVMPLVLDSSDLIAPDFPETSDETPADDTRLHLAVAEQADAVEQADALEAETVAPPQINPWHDPAPTGGFDLQSIWADPPQRETHPPERAEAATDTARSIFFAEPASDTPLSDTAQPEETMLNANASVTPINANIGPQYLPEMEAARDSGEPHLFAPQDKDAQKGTHLRGMIREAIRQELQGEIGNRLSRNLQQMIRHEIELTLRQMCEQE